MKLRLASLALLSALAACAASPQNDYYLLTPAAGATTALPAVSLSIPAYIDRAQIVYQDGEGNVDIREFDRWAEPADSMIKRVLAQDIAAHAAPGASPAGVKVVIDDFIFDGDRVTLRAHWTPAPRDGARGRPQSHGFDQTAPASSDTIGGSVTAMSGLLDRLGADIAAQNPSAGR